MKRYLFVATLAVILASAPLARSQQVIVAAPPLAAPGGVVVEAGPRVIPDGSKASIPPGYRVKKRARVGLIVGGAVTFGLAYSVSVVAAFVGTAGNCGGDGTCTPGEVRYSYGAMYVPAIGPFIELGSVGAAAGGKAFLVGDGLVQVGGLTLLALGIALPRTVLVRAASDSSAAARLSLMPLLGQGRSGISLVGAF
jgi:hypothetical protein